MLRVAINGFGRIGRSTMRAMYERKGIMVVAVNDLTDPETLAYLLQYDSVFRRWDHEVKAGKGFIEIDGTKIPVYAQKDPMELPWKKHNVDVVIESTGFFRKEADARKHIEAGAKKVVISAPSDDVPTFLMGVNHKTCKKSNDVVNNASCTTNSIAPVAQILTETIGVKKAMLTTIHSVTASQNVVDGLPAKKTDFRIGRSALVNIIPTSTGAAKATTQVVTALKDKFDGIAVRIPTLDVSLTDFTFVVKKRTSVEEVNKLFTQAARSARWKGILGVTDEPLVSSDFIGSPYGSVVDLQMTRVVDGDLVKVLAWYDNEWGYTQRLIDMAEYVGKL
ncbi:type I glyceraldehyde-3-phosphate dehydrogenase [Candidatus Uhrbacteria bacterium CG_4_9_14_3_um_filter_50_9]|uniref:Glyceraldehyde-3-phosphate dehydrogenase n=1 Tax=Candidatus Uhrbacteria bacterium CG_4_9_14_3_um_filter_50_9 TaxID=1975035 RepID=A0A2M7XDF9_9BACT|nr:MAG: type I glyceraldehyde-3-phosphate dehydrogenase [Candidatus Uhrbacteria bacterium CG_4_9_14_3_um_filter_50_9]